MNQDHELAPLIKPMLGRRRRLPVVLCIGSDRVTGDCLGPIVGQLLERMGADAHVYGTLSSPVTALNLTDTMALIRRRHAGSRVIAVDSSIGEQSEVGKIRIVRGCLRPGAADGKKLPRVGDISITATVAADSHKNLYSVRLGLVYELAESIAKALSLALTNTI